MSKRTLFLIFALLIIAFVLVMMAIYQPSASKTTPAPAITKEPVAQTILSFGEPVIATSSSALRQSADLNYSVPVNITTGKNKVMAVQLELQYDPLILTNVAVVPTNSFFPNPETLLNQIDTDTGRISYAFDSGLKNPGVVGKGTAANLTFSIKASVLTKTAIIFLPKTLVIAEEVSESVLKESVNGLFTLGRSNSTPSATPIQ